jgi:hypothetical protein
MPELSKVISEQDLVQKARPQLDLAVYTAIIENITEQTGVGGEVTLAEGESQRTEKRRLSLAAKEKGYKLTWRKAPDSMLKFVLSKEGEVPPGGRRKKDAAPTEPTEQSPRRGRRK